MRIVSAGSPKPHVRVELERALRDAYDHLDVVRTTIRDLESGDEARAAAAAELVTTWRGGRTAERNAATRGIVRTLWMMRDMVRQFARQGMPAAALEREWLRRVRGECHRGCFDGWSDDDIRSALRARRFDVVMAGLMTKHGCPMTAKNIEAKLRGVRGKRKP